MPKNYTWIFKYGLDWLNNYGEINIETIFKFLDIDTHRIKYHKDYSHFKEMLNERKIVHNEKENN